MPIETKYPEADWFKVTVTTERLRWWRAHPEIKPPPDDERDFIPDEEPSGLFWFRNSRGGLTPHLHMADRITLRNSYTFDRTYAEAQKRKRPLLAPHHAFRSIRNLYELVQFLGRFGPPLDEAPGTLSEADGDEVPERPDGDWLDLDDTWRRVQRYRAVSSLLPLVSDPDTERAADLLRERWSWILAHREELTVAGDLVFSEARFSPGRIPYDELRQISVRLLHDELKKSLKGRNPDYFRSIEDGAPVFRLGFEKGTLWVKVWEFLADDTVNKVRWRLCPHCGVTFFPPRRERYYCSAKIQHLYANREWWRKNRGSGFNSDMEA